MNSLQVDEVEKHEKYLDLPTIIGRHEKVIFSQLIERIWRKIQCWREILLPGQVKKLSSNPFSKQSRHIYDKNFRIAYGVIDEIHTMLAKFWWGASEDHRKLHWLSRGTLCKPKSKGGIGIKYLRVFNQPLLAKQGWRFRMILNPIVAYILK
ncbi:unnamed protein product [Cuscuta epithymum]|uniref:Uncharacterized protein n=1 Tax=Cuscuta epithymum TaxID=186058 RepID=A0AAV0CJ45_9ASTE|nr:unnamed protein product [Cuscuta epithymum]